MVEDWESALAEIGTPRTEGISPRCANSMKRGEPDADRIHALLHRLRTATTKISDKAEKSQDKVKVLGKALAKAGEDSTDEADDVEAAAAPKRPQEELIIDRAGSTS